jgi:predicted Zn-dependent peptidase
LLAAYDATIRELSAKGPSQQDLDRVVTKMRSDSYGQLEIPITRASALSHAVLFTGSFESVFNMPDELTKVTPDQVREFAAKYLVSTNRTIINRVPVPASPDAGKSGGAQ